MAGNTKTKKEIEYAPFAALTAKDRCDRCGAQAYAQARKVKERRLLLFCAHHLREHLPALTIQKWEIRDDSDQLTG